MNKIESGSIFKFVVPFGLGKAYCKLVDFSNESKYDGITIKVYDYFQEDDIDDPVFFKNMPLFMNPLPIVKPPSLRGKYAWKKIGVLSEAADVEIPIYKRGLYEGFGWDSYEKYSSQEWFAFVDLSNKIGPVPLGKVQHLEELFWRSTVTIELRVAMQLLRYRNVDVKEFLSANLEDAAWRIDYNTQMTIPLYKNIPEPIRGKPLIKGWVPDEYLNYDFGSIDM